MFDTEHHARTPVLDVSFFDSGPADADALIWHLR